MSPLNDVSLDTWSKIANYFRMRINFSRKFGDENSNIFFYYYTQLDNIILIDNYDKVFPKFKIYSVIIVVSIKSYRELLSIL